LDPFRGYANTIRDELPDAVAVLDAFHVVKLGSTALDEVRRRVQQETLGPRGLKDDPLYRIRRTLMTGLEHLTDKQRARLDRHLPTGDLNRPGFRGGSVTWFRPRWGPGFYGSPLPAGMPSGWPRTGLVGRGRSRRGGGGG
jgi:hypothetical protein